ncbi:MAG: hypothetical protein ACAH59_11390 [Pseudobdellovibrionaceae bacterium]
MKSVFFIAFMILSVSAQAQQACDRMHYSASVTYAVSGVLGFHQDSKLLQDIKKIVASAKYKTQVEKVEGFNDQILILDAPRLEKLIRQETPYTVSLMGREVITQAPGLAKFRQIGLVHGDPHFGNMNIQPLLFRQGHGDRNRYTVVDLDEVSVGVFSLDFTRYMIFLKASYAKLNKAFGKDFEQELMQSYYRGLQQKSYGTLPSFIAKPLAATPKQIRQKVSDYANARVDKDGKFRERYFKSNELAEFAVKNMKPGFLAKLNFNQDLVKRKEFKKLIEEALIKAAQSDLGARVQVLDIAIPVRSTGGSAQMQRFLLSTRVQMDGESYPMILEFKENTDKAGWEAVIEAPVKNATERYGLGLRATMDDAGPLMKVINLSSQASFLMRPRGNLDIEVTTSAQTRDLALFDAYLMGLFHGGQGPEVSGNYQKQVQANPELFQQTVMEIADKVLKRLSEESGLKK